MYQIRPFGVGKIGAKGTKFVLQCKSGSVDGLMQKPDLMTRRSDCELLRNGRQRRFAGARSDEHEWTVEAWQAGGRSRMARTPSPDHPVPLSGAKTGAALCGIVIARTVLDRDAVGFWICRECRQDISALADIGDSET